MTGGKCWQGEQKKNDKYYHSKQKKAEHQTTGDGIYSGIKGLQIDVKWGEKNGKTITHC
jgi:hypothetical protein